MRYLDYAQGEISTTGTTGLTKAPYFRGRGERMVLVLDASPSMEETDWPPSRIGAAREAAWALVQRKRKIAPGDEVAAVTYADRAKVICALLNVSTHHRRIKAALNGISTDSWTNITAGLNTANGLFQASPGQTLKDWFFGTDVKNQHDRTKRIVLLTDGQHNHGREPKSIARKLKASGVCIDCIGIGGSPSDVDEKLLKDIASKDPRTGKPRYVFIGDKADLIAKFEQLAGRISR